MVADEAPLASWADAVRVIDAAFAIVIRGDDWVGLLHDELKCKVALATALARPFLAITADVLDAGDLAAEAALALNHLLPLGALELEDGRYLLRATLPLTGLAPVDLRRVVLHVCRQGAHMQAHRAARGVPELFLHFSD